MSKASHYIQQSEHQHYYQQCWDEFSEDQRQQLELLLEKLESAGASDPSGWAFSEVSEGIPQLARFLLLKESIQISDDIDDNLCLAEDIEAMDEQVLESIQSSTNPDELKRFLQAYGRGLLWSFSNLLDQGSDSARALGVDWVLRQHAQGEQPEKAIGGLHENLIDFDDELL